MQNMTTSSGFGCSYTSCRKKIFTRESNCWRIFCKNKCLSLTTVRLVSIGFICAHRAHWSCLIQKLQLQIRRLLTMRSSVASPRSPPNVMIGVRHAKYRKKMDATDCNANASLKSLKYQGSFLFTSLINPPNSLENTVLSNETVPQTFVLRVFERTNFSTLHCAKK